MPNEKDSSNILLNLAFGIIMPIGKPGFNPRLSHTKDFKMVLDTSLLSTQQYMVRTRGKVEQSRERSSVLSYTSVL